MKMDKCRICGKPILLLKTTKGKTLPCDPKPVQFVPELFATTRYVMSDGEMYRGVEPAENDLDIHDGFICHFDVCKGPKGGKRK